MKASPSELLVYGHTIDRLALLKMLGIRRALERVTYIWRNANNFVQVEVRELARDRLEVWINEVGRQPQTFLGIVHGAMRYLTGKAHRVTIAHREGHSCTYLIELGKSPV